jgi:hypothetical protein
LRARASLSAASEMVECYTNFCVSENKAKYRSDVLNGKFNVFRKSITVTFSILSMMVF